MKTPTEMTLAELETAAPKMSDEELNAAFLAEKAAGADKERAGAIKLYTKLADDRGFAFADPAAPVDGEVALAVPGAQPAGPQATEEEREEHARKVLALEERVAKLEAETGAIPAGGDFDARTEILKLHRQVAALANHHNFPLPA